MRKSATLVRKARRPLSVLIVEDNQSDVKLLLDQLYQGGFDVSYELVETGATMRSALHHQKWDVITSDHGMPHFSGTDALALTRELRSEVPFIFVSAESDLNLAVGLMRNGAQDYVQKAELGKLIPAIERVLRKFSDRTNQMAGERALRKSEDRYKRLFETARDGILIVAANTGRIQDVNPSLLDLLGFSREEYLGKHLWEVAAFDDSEASKPPFFEMQKKGYIRQDNIPLHTKAGTRIDVEFISNIYDVGKEKVIQCNIRDNTVRRAAQTEIRSRNADLERRVSLRTAQVEVLNKELATFNHSVSHDLQAPLRRITGFVSALEKACREELSSKGKELIEEISASTEHMASLIHALLKLASLGKSELQRNKTDLTALMSKIATELQQGDPDRDVEFIIPDGVWASGDAAMLRIVLENLVGNAWKFTSLLAAARIEFGITQVAGKPDVYFVRDNGAGFDMLYADRLFGAFQRLHSDKEFPGTGIGLASVQRIIHLHGGRVWAQSAIGIGATFCFELEPEQSVAGSESSMSAA